MDLSLGFPEFSKELAVSSNPSLDAVVARFQALHQKTGYAVCARMIEKINRLEEVGDQLGRDAVSDLFRNEKDPITLLKLKEIYDFLEHTIDNCEDVATALLDDSIHHGQSQAGTLSWSLRRKKRLEDTTLSLGIHAAAAVGNRQHHVGAGLNGAVSPDLSLIESNALRLNAQRSPSGHCVTSIHRKIQDGLLDLALINFHSRQSRFDFDFQFDVS